MSLLDRLKPGDWVENTRTGYIACVERIVERTGGKRTAYVSDVLGQRRMFIHDRTDYFRKLNAVEVLALVDAGISRPFRPGDRVLVTDDADPAYAGREGITVSIRPLAIKPPEDHAFVLFDPRDITALPFTHIVHKSES